MLIHSVTFGSRSVFLLLSSFHSLRFIHHNYFLVVQLRTLVPMVTLWLDMTDHRLGHGNQDTIDTLSALVCKNERKGGNGSREQDVPSLKEKTREPLGVKGMKWEQGQKKSYNSQ